MKEDDNYRVVLEKGLGEWMSDSTIIRGPGAKAFVDEMILTLMEPFDLVKHAKEFSQKDILLTGGWLDRQTPLEDHILPFYRALLLNGAENLEIELFNDGHYFKNTKEKERLTTTIISWIKKKVGRVK
jgi:hypothetical protein